MLRDSWLNITRFNTLGSTLYNVSQLSAQRSTMFHNSQLNATMCSQFSTRHSTMFHNCLLNILRRFTTVYSTLYNVSQLSTQRSTMFHNSRLNTLQLFHNSRLNALQCFTILCSTLYNVSSLPSLLLPSSRHGYHVGWKPLEFRAKNAEHPVPEFNLEFVRPFRKASSRQVSTRSRGDPTYPDPRMQPVRTTPCQQETTKQAVDALVFEKMQTRMKLLEDSNFAMQSRNQNLLAENKALSSRVEEERNEAKGHEKRVAALLEELDREKFKLEETINAAERVGTKNVPTIEENGTSTTNILSKLERGVQVWAVCMGCQKKLESGAKQPSTVTITKSELEILEKDMQILRDTIIAREEAWDKAMEREQNYRQQLTRLTTETITARHLSETRQEELREATKTLSEKESELKSLQNENMHLNKVLAKLYSNHQRGQDECQKNNLTLDVNEKEQRFIEETIRRVSSTKGKQKSKSKNTCSDKTSNSYAYQASPRDKSSKAIKDPPSSFKESKR
ncbi:uncharacterized protein LOC143144949 [Ptiloglossa arizonensis]|uniref:uncharacterized protein LOC143144949 n=1 Tax=Ptiloglossa arizonensis TaxID=3350558 RepID=UPI003FA12E83